MRITAKLSLLTTGLLAASMMIGVATIFAAPSPHASAQTETQTAGQAADRKAAAQTKLADTKLKACQNREKAVTNIMSRLSDRGQKQLNLFSTIADRTEMFYKDKGNTLGNYDALVSDVVAKKTAAQAVVDTVKSTSIEFKCDGTDPKGAAQSFKDALKLEIDALKAYRTAVKNLIVGVKSVQGSTTSIDKNTEGGQQ